MRVIATEMYDGGDYEYKLFSNKLREFISRTIRAPCMTLAKRKKLKYPNRVRGKKLDFFQRTQVNLLFDNH